MLCASPIFSLVRNAAHGVVPRGGLPDGVKIGVGDSAYSRALDEWKDLIYLPAKLREDGENLEVRDCRAVWLALMGAWGRGRN